MGREVRCHGAVLKGDSILMVKHVNHRTGNVYWWLPGGGLQPGETQEECAVREIKEETHLEVRVERLLFETQDLSSRYTYERYATYLCTPIAGEALPGVENTGHSITGVDWYPVWDESRWEPGFYDEHVYPLLKSIQSALRADA